MKTSQNDVNINFWATTDGVYIGLTAFVFAAFACAFVAVFFAISKNFIAVTLASGVFALLVCCGWVFGARAIDANIQHSKRLKEIHFEI